MAAITSAQTGLWSATSTWVGGVVPGAADTVTISATHVVTLDGAYVTGGDTAGGFVVRGTVKASRTVNSSLTVRANINVAQSGAGLDFGTNSDPIPQGVTAELVVNASATPAAGKYNISSPGGVNGVFFRFCGAPKTRNAFLAAPVSAGATSIQVTDASGWVVGDSLFLEQPTNDVLQTQTVTITSISGTTIGVSAVTLARVSGLAVSNISCNVLIRSQTATAASTNYFRCSTSPSATGIVEVRNCEIRDIGYLYLDYPSSNNVVVANTPTFDSCYVSGTSSSRAMIGGVFGTYEMLYSNNILIGGTGYTQQNLFEPNLSFATVTNSVFYMLGTTAFSGAFGYNSTWGLNVINSRLNGYYGCVTQSTAGLQTFTNCRFRSKFNEPYSGGQANIQFNNCDFLTQSGAKYVKLSFNASGSVNIQNPTVDDVTKLNPNASYNTMKVNAYSINGVFNANRSYTYNCAAVNQNAVVNRATNNIALQLNNSQTTGQYTFTFQGVSGVSQRIVGYLRHDTTYGTSNPPSISFSGAGVSGSFTSASTVDIWEKFDITITPTSTGTVTATVNFAGAAGGTAYLDAVYQFPFITESWIYGFQKLAQVNSVVDPNITLSESAVAALTTCATFDDVYDAAAYSAIVSGPAAGAYTVIATAAGTNLAFGSNSVTINNGAASAFAFSAGVATVKAAALTSGAKFKSMSAAGFIMTTPVTNTSLTGNVAQATPTDLTGVTVTGNLTYNTNTPITITLTNCTISGTISNSGSGLVTVRRSNTTIGTVGTNITAPLVTSITLTNINTASSVYVADGSGNQIDYVGGFAALLAALGGPVMVFDPVTGTFTPVPVTTTGGAIISLGVTGTTYTLDTTGGTGTWTYKVVEYGKLAITGTHTPAISSVSQNIVLNADPYITQASAVTVAAYTTLQNPDRIYDYAAYWETKLAGIPLPRVISKAASYASAGSYPLILSSTSPLAWDLTGGTLTLKTTANFVPGTTMTGGIITSGAITLSAQATTAGTYAGIASNTVAVSGKNVQNLSAIASISGLPTSGDISTSGSLDFGFNSNIVATGNLSASNSTLTGALQITAATPHILSLTNCNVSGLTIYKTAGYSNITVKCYGSTNAALITTGGGVTAIKAAPILAPNLLAGSRVRVYNNTDGVEVYNGVLSNAGFSYEYAWTANKSVTLTATYCVGTAAKLGLSATGVLTSNGVTFLNSQVDDAVYNEYAINGSLVTGFTADYTQDDVNLTTATNFAAADFYAWWIYNTTTEEGIRNFFGGVVARDTANLEVQVPIVNLFLDNTTSTFVYQLDTIRFYRSDGAYPARTVTTGGGGITVNWLANVYVGTANVPTPEEIAVSVWSQSLPIT
jgi:hypothetical protein